MYLVWAFLILYHHVYPRPSYKQASHTLEHWSVSESYEIQFVPHSMMISEKTEINIKLKIYLVTCNIAFSTAKQLTWFECELTYE